MAEPLIAIAAAIAVLAFVVAMIAAWVNRNRDKDAPKPEYEHCFATGLTIEKDEPSYREDRQW